MLTQKVNADQMLQLFLLDSDIEKLPEAFRCQHNLILVITFEEYLKFIEQESLFVKFLNTSDSELYKYIRKYRLSKDEGSKEFLFSAFLKDMAFAVGKELCYAEASGKRATNIIHSIDGDCISWGVLDIYDMFRSIPRSVIDEYSKVFRNNGYVLPTTISMDNEWLFKYAIVLYACSKSIIFYWSYKF